MRYKLVMMNKVGVIGREARFSHVDDAEDMGVMWAEFAPQNVVQMIDEETRKTLRVWEVEVA